ncbi:NaeI family type II restriction endonuclease [Microbacterium sp. SSM24]|uniref:NaeI family type II restriction endonuclease n=1 Tax=Microbacterium sp. SSM24 TaxID=2991714 RepID=UPI00222740BD|nr:NaeI family type II restriction endonuclease [Microbacterium sp. SSM24]MCW3493899.1 NaeI family type II restriction endonuclease [Microbacterium sp. SSM24]
MSDGLLALFDPPADPALEDVAEELLKLDPQGDAWAAVIRHTYDMIYNGQETGRYRWDQLMKTEKTHFGTVFEINAQREFKFAGIDEDPTDYRICGHLVDAKWSQTDGRWMLPPEVTGHIALVATGSDVDSVWSLGLVRVLPRYRTESANRDKKSTLNKEGRAAIRWLWRNEPLRPNVLLQLDQSAVEQIVALKAGTKRTDQLFRVAEGRIVHRSAVLTVARQLDAMRRLRGGSGGSRRALAPDGLLILSGAYHAQIARDLGAPAPRRDEFISVRVVPSAPGQGACISGGWWRLAAPGERTILPAPDLPREAP